MKKGGAGREVIKALRFLLATPDELQTAQAAGQSTGQWLADILEYRQLPTAMTPFDYIKLSNATELRIQQAGFLPLSTDTAVVVLSACFVCFFLLACTGYESTKASIGVISYPVHRQYVFTSFALLAVSDGP